MHVLSWLGQLDWCIYFLSKISSTLVMQILVCCVEKQFRFIICQNIKGASFLFWQPIHPATCLKNFIAAKIASVMLERNLTEACKGF